MNLSRGALRRWVIEGVDEDTVRYAKSLAAEHGLRVAHVLDAAIMAAWRYHAAGEDMAAAFEDRMNVD